MNIGEKIKRLRKKNELTQEELADRAELSKGFISQIERELTSPSIATLVDILQCLGTDLKEFFSEFEDKQVVFSKEDYFVKKDEMLGNEIHWLVPNAQKNTMEPVMLTIEAMGKTVLDQPHEGEEFGYVMQGTVTVWIGKEHCEVNRGDSFYYMADKPHYIENKGSEPAIVLWISSPPRF